MWEQEEALPAASSSSSSEEEDLPPASRGQVFWACTQTSVVLTGLALALRQVAGQLGPAALHTDAAQVARLLAGTLQLLYACSFLHGTLFAHLLFSTPFRSMLRMWHVRVQCQTSWRSAMRRRCWHARGR